MFFNALSIVVHRFRATSVAWSSRAGDAEGQGASADSPLCPWAPQVFAASEASCASVPASRGVILYGSLFVTRLRIMRVSQSPHVDEFILRVGLFVHLRHGLRVCIGTAWAGNTCSAPPSPAATTPPLSSGEGYVPSAQAADDGAGSVDLPVDDGVKGDSSPWISINNDLLPPSFQFGQLPSLGFVVGVQESRYPSS